MRARSVRKSRGFSAALGPYVNLVMRRQRKWNLRVASCPAEIAEWIEAEALKHDVLPGEMARAMLVDAVNEAMEGGG